MKRASSSLLLAAGLLCAASAGAQLYKSVAPDGKVTYSDTPPPAAARVEKKLPNRTDGADTLPHGLAEAVKKSPVTLYTTDNCKPCAEGRTLLKQRGIPFSEKTVHSNDDLAVLRQAGGDQQLPLLKIGHQKQQGFEADGWHSALTNAGYPEASQLPKAYQYAAAVPAAPQQPVATPKPVVAEQAADGGARAPAPPTGNAPPGFRF